MFEKSRLIDFVMMAVLLVVTVAVTLLFMSLSQANGGFATPRPDGVNQGVTIAVMIHLGTALPALLLGPIILFRRKGDKRHKLLGRIWVGLMLVTAIASAFIRAPGAGVAGTGFSFIHIFTVWTLISVPMGLYFIRRGNQKAHRDTMTGLYAGLCIAGAFTLIPGRLLGNMVFG